jgi:hypothetical protein
MEVQFILFEVGIEFVNAPYINYKFQKIKENVYRWFSIVTAREADHSTPTSAEVKKTWIYTSTPPYVFMA